MISTGERKLNYWSEFFYNIIIFITFIKNNFSKNYMSLLKRILSRYLTDFFFYRPQASSCYYSVSSLWKTVGRHGHSFSYVGSDIHTHPLLVLWGNVFHSVFLIIIIVKHYTSYMDFLSTGLLLISLSR